MDTLVRTVTLNGFLTVCNLHGLNSHELLRAVGLNAGSLVDAECHISAETLCRLLDLAAQESACSAFGVQMAQNRQTLDFGSEFNGLVFHAADLKVPNPSADPELVRYAESVVMPLHASEDKAVLQEVRRNIYLLMPLDQAKIERVAERMNLSARTLQRQLDQSGTSFSELLDSVRKNLVLRYLKNQRYSIGQVASLTGYSRQASFTRWFQQNFGMSPRQWRQVNPS